MAAVLSPAPSSRPGLAPHRPPAPRPVLRVIDGGRSSTAMAPVYRRRRIVAALALATVIVLAVMAAEVGRDLAAGWAAPVPATIEGRTVVVEAAPGDTLWTVARRVRPTGDVRPVVEAMLSERGSAELQVGDAVRVPAG